MNKILVELSESNVEELFNLKKYWEKTALPEKDLNSVISTLIKIAWEEIKR